MTASPHWGEVPEFTKSDRIRKAREVAGLSQGELAERLGITTMQLAATMLAAAHALGDAPTGWIMGPTWARQLESPGWCLGLPVTIDPNSTGMHLAAGVSERLR